LHEGLLNANDEFVVEQGTKMGRRSLLCVRFKPDPKISGTGVIAMQGRLHLP
jgi:predicted PhzF superfamily epimerase YddE/YHI9